jgi:hypothetical protein
MDESLGTLKHVMVLLSCVCVLYLVVKQTNLTLPVSISKTEGFSPHSHSLRYTATVSDSPTHRGWNN